MSPRRRRRDAEAPPDSLQTGSRYSGFFSYPTGREDDSDELVFLDDRPEDDWSRLLGYTTTRRFSAGEVIIEYGEAERALYIVVDGWLRISVPGKGPSGTVAPHSVIGELAFLDGRPRSATIEGETSGELLRLSFDAYEVLAARYPDLGRAIALDLGRIAAARLRRSEAPAREVG